MFHLAALPPSPEPNEVPSDEPVRFRPKGPGWFDSSWELRSGLQVKEGLPADLPLQGWIEAWLQLVGGGSGLSLSAT